MYIEINGAQYPCATYHNNSDTFVVSNVIGINAAPEAGDIDIYADSGFLLVSVAAEHYSRHLLIENTLTLTNVPEPIPPTHCELVAGARKMASERIDGKCTAAIYNGYTVNGVHYYFTERAQLDWNGSMLQVLGGATTVSVKVNGAWVKYTADQVKEISGVMKDIIYIMRMYNQQLEAWIARETDEAVLSTIDFGSKLPEDLMATFQKDATDAGVDLTKYASLLA